MFSKMFKSNFWIISGKKLKPIGKDIYGLVYLSNLDHLKILIDISKRNIYYENGIFEKI